MRRWEYLHVRLDWAGFDERVQDYGRDGWELVGWFIRGELGDFVFKRIVESEDELLVAMKR